MKFSIPVLILLSISCAAGAAAQSTSSAWSTPKDQAPRLQPPAKPVEQAVPGRVGLIDSRAFYDEKVGIQKMIAAYKSLEREFAPRKAELSQLQQKLTNAADEMKRLGADSKTSPELLTAKKEEIDRLQRELEFKREDAKSAYGKRERDVISPLFAHIGKALEEFMATRGVSVILDSAKMGEALLAVMPNADLTVAFINDYNLRNPAPPSLASAR